MAPTALLLLAVALGSPRRATSARIPGGLVREDAWLTVHDLDASESLAEHKVIHTEEDCETCYQGDIQLPPASEVGGRSSLLEAWSNMSSGARNKPWPGGTVHYRWKKDIASKAKEVSEMAMRIWESKTCVRFREVTGKHASGAQAHPVNMGSDKKGCNAHAGYHGASWQSYNLGEGCHHVGTALHELGHVLGLSHEHERYDRDEYVETFLPNIQKDFQRWFGVNPWRSGVAKNLPYDLSSIMHYDAWAFATKKDYNDPSKASIRVKKKDPWGNCKIGQRSQLSIGDLLTVKAIYGCEEPFCADLRADCPGFKGRGLCPGGSGDQEHKTWMEKHCRATCGICACQDKSADCAKHAARRMCPGQAGGTAENREWMRQNCAKSCGICGPSDISCQDKPCIEGWPGCKKCERFANVKSSTGMAYCGYQMIQRSCPRSCGTCPAQVYC